MKRRTFLKIAVGALVFPKLIVVVPDEFVVSSGTAIINGKIVDFGNHGISAELWCKKVFEECKEKTYLAKFVSNESYPIQMVKPKKIYQLVLTKSEKICRGKLPRSFDL